MVNIQGEVLQPFPTFQAEVKKTKRDTYFLFIYRGSSRRNPFLPAEMVNIQREVLQPFPTFQTEVKKT